MKNELSRSKNAFPEVMACIEAEDVDAFDAAMARLTAADDQLLAALRTVLS